MPVADFDDDFIIILSVISPLDLKMINLKLQQE